MWLIILLWLNRMRRNRRRQPIKRQPCRKQRKWLRSALYQQPTYPLLRKCSYIQFCYIMFFPLFFNSWYNFTNSILKLPPEGDWNGSFWTHGLIGPWQNLVTVPQFRLFYAWLADVLVNVVHTQTPTIPLVPFCPRFKTRFSDCSESERNTFGALWSKEEREANSR